MKRKIIIYLPIILTAAIILTLKFFVFYAIVPTESMEPTIPPKSYIIGLKRGIRGQTINYDDIIVFHHKEFNELLVKRVIGLPGDTITLDDTKIYRNEIEVPDMFIKETAYYGSTRSYLIPERCYFVMGDNRNNSNDSSKWNDPFVQDKNVIGKVIAVYNSGSFNVIKNFK